MIKTGFLYISIIILTVSCGISSYQTGRVTPIEEIVTTVGFSGIISKNLDKTITDPILPIVEVVIRTGYLKNIDYGFKLTNLLMIGGDIRYQFIGDQQSFYAGNVGLGARFSFLKYIKQDSTKTNETSNKYNNSDLAKDMMDFYIPFSFSIHPKDNFSVYFSPELSLKYYKILNNRVFYGATLGVMIGKEWKIAVEYSILASESIITNQFSIGFIF